MPGLISSSSSSGPRAAPKAAPRRRPGQTTAAAATAPKSVTAVARDHAEVTQPLQPQGSHVTETLPVTKESNSSRQDGQPESLGSSEIAKQAESADDNRSESDHGALIAAEETEVPAASWGRLGLSPSAVRRPSQDHTPLDQTSNVDRGRQENVVVPQQSQTIPPSSTSEARDGAIRSQVSEPERPNNVVTPAAASEEVPAPAHPSPKRKRNPQAKTPRARPAKKTKQDVTEGGELLHTPGDDQAVETIETDAQPRALKPPSRLRRGAKVANDADTSTSADKAATKAPRKPRARKKKTSEDAENPDIQADQIENMDPIHEIDTTMKKRPRKRRANGSTDQPDDQATPADDPELHVIDPTQLSMWDLSHDTTNGKMSELGKRMAEIDWDEVARKRRLEESGVQIIPEKAPDEAVALTIEGQEVVEQLQAEAAKQRDTDGGRQDGDIELQMDADGNIIANDEALVRVLNAEAEAAANSAEPVTEENPLTSRINRTTWINANKRDPKDRVPLWRGKSDPWSEEMTDKFYEALRMFGTDFFIISKMFAPKTRRMIKAKFVREERLDPSRITKALLGLESTPMDLEHYARETGQDIESFTKYQGLEDAATAMREELEPTAEKMTATIEQEVADAEKEAEQAAAKQAEKAARKGRKGKKMAGGTMGGVPDD